MSGHVKVGGAWKTVSSVSAKVGGAWKSVASAYTKIGGVWKQWYSSVAPPAYELIGTVDLAVDTATATFSSIPQDYKHLQIRYAIKTSTTRRALYVQMNNVATASYSSHQLYGNGTSVLSTNTVSQTEIRFDNAMAQGTANIYAGGVMDILDYSSTAKNTTVRLLSGVVGADAGNQNVVALHSGLFINTSAVTTLTLKPSADLFERYSRFSLYGIRG